MKKVGQVIYAHRKKKGWSQQQTAERFGLMQSDISQMESGREPGAEVLRLICKASGLSADYLLGLKP